MIRTKKSAKKSHKKGQRKKVERIELKLKSRYGTVYLDIFRNPRWNHVRWGELLMSEDAYFYSEFLEASALNGYLSKILDENKERLGRSWPLSTGGAIGSFNYLPEDLVEPVSSIALKCMQEALDRVEPRNWRNSY